MNDHFAMITPSGSKRVIDLKQAQPRSEVVEDAAVCLDRSKDLVDALPERDLCSQFPPSDPALWWPKAS
ncbi:hypothetical protein [Rhizobium sp. NFR12]|uniref:hypothetical protein n=1 Tax=Rhizobium/Agrobacterium group TaxID=227290 RepID=UPI001115011E|nr:hypothetical protein [Rhizobium sp. NFR12]